MRGSVKVDRGVVMYEDLEKQCASSSGYAFLVKSLS